MSNRNSLLQDCKEMVEGLIDFDELDLEIEKQLLEANLIAEKVKTFVEDYASASLPQTEFETKYKALEEKYNEAYGKYQELVKLKEHRLSQTKAIKVFLKALEEKPLVLEEWDNSCWTLFVEKAVVHRDKSITFEFTNGTKIKIEAQD